MTDYVTTLLSAVWTLLAGRTNFASTVRPGNRVALTGGIRWPEKHLKGAADLPQAKLRVLTDQTPGLTASGAMKTFGNATGATPTDFIADETVTLELSIEYAGLDEVLPNQMVAEVKAAFFNAGVTLGQAKVKTWGPISERRSQKPTSGSSKGTVQTISIPIVLRLRKADLVGQ